MRGPRLFVLLLIALVCVGVTASPVEAGGFVRVPVVRRGFFSPFVAPVVVDSRAFIAPRAAFVVPRRSFVSPFFAPPVETFRVNGGCGALIIQ